MERGACSRARRHGSSSTSSPSPRIFGLGHDASARAGGDRERREMHALPASKMASRETSRSARQRVRRGVPSRATAPCCLIGFDPAAAEAPSVSRRRSPVGDGVNEAGGHASRSAWWSWPRSSDTRIIAGARAAGSLVSLWLCTGASTMTRQRKRRGERKGNGE